MGRYVRLGIESTTNAERLKTDGFLGNSTNAAKAQSER